MKKLLVASLAFLLLLGMTACETSQEPQAPTQPNTDQPVTPNQPEDTTKPDNNPNSDDGTNPDDTTEPEIPAEPVLKDYAEEVYGQYFTMIPVQGGEFEMGAAEHFQEGAFEDEYPAHKVHITGFYLSQTEVTKAQYKAVMEDYEGFLIGGNFPASGISWEQAQAFCQKLSQLTDKHYVLPTEAQWEYAARGGENLSLYIYSGAHNIDDVAWYGETQENTVEHPVALRKPNALGLFDMSGNVWEWCSDYYAPYSAQTQVNPTGPTEGTKRVIRGGSWGSAPRYVRVTNRYAVSPANHSKYYGFRVAMIP